MPKNGKNYWFEYGDDERMVSSAFTTKEGGIARIKDICIEEGYPIPQNENVYRFVKVKDVVHDRYIQRVDVLYNKEAKSFRRPKMMLGEIWRNV